jgi:hypothetical protein
MTALRLLTRRLSEWLEYGRGFGPTPVSVPEVLAALRSRV